MILVLAGTRDGRELAVKLAEAGCRVVVSVISEYGRCLAEHPQVSVRVGALDEAGLCSLIQSDEIRYLLDASHPYAAGISSNAMKAAAQTGIVYLRYERPATPLPDYDRLYVVPDAQQAARQAAQLGETVFLTTGSRTLAAFKDEPALHNHRIIARVLPEPAVIQECVELGFKPSDIIAAQGPFNLEINIAMLRFFGADVIVTKNGGEVGGSDAKVDAAIHLGLPLVMIEKPEIHYPCIFTSIEGVLNFFKEELTCNI